MVKRDVSISHNFVIRNILNFTSLQRKLLFTFCERLMDSKNTVIYSCVHSDSYFHSNFWKHFRSILY